VIFATAFGNFALYKALKAVTASRAWRRSSAFQISASAFFAPGCADFGNADNTFEIL
jgi:hypothetical protein